MYYRPKNELITVSARDENGSSSSRYILADHKKAMWGKLNYLIGAEKRKNKFALDWRDEYCHFVDGVFGNCPLIINYLTLRGFKNVLFVGYYEAGTRYWTTPRKGNSILEAPSIMSDNLTMPSPNVWIQFLPIVKQCYNYEGSFNMHTLAPPEWRYRHIVHALYGRYDVPLFASNKQYMYGQKELKIERPLDVKYDAVVFGACRYAPETESINISQVAQPFAPHITSDCTFIELKYRVNSDQKMIEGVRENNDEWLESIFTQHTIWDQGYKHLSPNDRSIFYQEINNIIASYKNPLVYS